MSSSRTIRVISPAETKFDYEANVVLPRINKLTVNGQFNVTGTVNATHDPTYSQNPHEETTVVQLPHLPRLDYNNFSDHDMLDPTFSITSWEHYLQTALSSNRDISDTSAQSCKFHRPPPPTDTITTSGNMRAMFNVPKDSKLPANYCALLLDLYGPSANIKTVDNVMNVLLAPINPQMTCAVNWNSYTPNFSVYGWDNEFTHFGEYLTGKDTSTRVFNLDTGIRESYKNIGYAVLDRYVSTLNDLIDYVIRSDVCDIDITNGTSKGVEFAKRVSAFFQNVDGSYYSFAIDSGMMVLLVTYLGQEYQRVTQRQLKATYFHGLTFCGYIGKGTMMRDATTNANVDIEVGSTGIDKTKYPGVHCTNEDVTTYSLYSFPYTENCSQKKIVTPTADKDVYIRDMLHDPLAPLVYPNTSVKLSQSSVLFINDNVRDYWFNMCTRRGSLRIILRDIRKLVQTHISLIFMCFARSWCGDIIRKLDSITANFKTAMFINFPIAAPIFAFATTAMGRHYVLDYDAYYSGFNVEYPKHPNYCSISNESLRTPGDVKIFSKLLPKDINANSNNYLDVTFKDILNGSVFIGSSYMNFDSYLMAHIILPGDVYEVATVVSDSDEAVTAAITAKKSMLQYENPNTYVKDGEVGLKGFPHIVFSISPNLDTYGFEHVKTIRGYNAEREGGNISPNTTVNVPIITFRLSESGTTYTVCINTTVGSQLASGVKLNDKNAVGAKNAYECNLMYMYHTQPSDTASTFTCTHDVYDPSVTNMVGFKTQVEQVTVNYAPNVNNLSFALFDRTQDAIDRMLGVRGK